MGSWAEEPDFELEGEEKIILNVGSFKTLPELDEDVWTVGGAGKSLRQRYRFQGCDAWSVAIKELC